MIYFDNAATTLQKPLRVTHAVTEAMRTMTSPGRGDYGAEAKAAKTLLDCREAAGAMFRVAEPERVVLTFNATHSLNIAVKSLVKPGSTVLLSGFEHNAVTRPLSAVSGVKCKVMHAPLFSPDLFLEELEQKLTAEIDVMICTHVSNVFGYILPLEQVAALCRKRQVPLLVDASQSAGVLPISLENLGAEFIAFPGHKALYGPQGTGFLLCRSSGEPVLEGGTGSASLRQEMPDFLPDRLEAGTHNMPGVAGVREGIRFVASRGTEALLRHEAALKNLAAEGLRKMPGIQVFQCRRPDCQTGVLSFRVEGQDCGRVGDYLAGHGIAARAGLHCAPLAHHTVGTVSTGTVRISFSAFNTQQEVERFLKEMRRFP